MKLQHNKTDAGDAELLAEIARTGFCRAVAVKSEAAQEVRVLIKARAHLVRQRCDTENAIRGLLGSVGLRFPKGAGKLAWRVRTALEARAGDCAGLCRHHRRPEPVRQIAHGGAQVPALVGRGAAWIRRRSGHKKACVALARKLAVILHRMLITGELFRWPERRPEKKADATA